MPEGPEVWILSKAINNYYSNDNTFSYGKHLIIKDKKQNWSFGLKGKVDISPNELFKLECCWLHGDTQSFNDESEIKNKLGLDWLTCSKEELEQCVSKWRKSKKKLAGLLLDQTLICGIGVAWGSEILLEAGLRPELKACEQNLDLLVDSMLKIRTQVMNVYNDELFKLMEVCKIYGNNDKLRLFVNEWYENLYQLRTMLVYKKGNSIEVLGRKWWVTNG